MKQVFKLSSTKLQEPVLVTYFNGYLNVVEIGFKYPMSEFQFDHFIRLLPYKIDISKFTTIGFTVEEIQELPANKKIALFCLAYEKHYGIKYKASRSDGGKISSIKITKSLLEYYFASQNFLFKGKHSVSNLVRYYNELHAEIISYGKPKHPDSWSAAYENKLRPEEVADYWRHLREKGLKPIKDKVGNTLDWR
ncbi:hypothetical protein [Sphingobacterium hotanense]|uniref:Uncharacterized protein n=1 Tax=Sphingobacterium hotanense TaxID=649196 RepID=A0ABT7NLG3_9SPHI|nr:hypothetical protein [Sphingobacterium hotanense]MDM1048043.1 hypothetical protein [Sphingobacterium hotanense]